MNHDQHASVSVYQGANSSKQPLQFPTIDAGSNLKSPRTLTFQREGYMTTDIHEELYNQFTRSLDMNMFTLYPVMTYRSKTFLQSHLTEKQKLRIFKYLSQFQSALVKGLLT